MHKQGQTEMDGFIEVIERELKHGRHTYKAQSQTELNSWSMKMPRHKDRDKHIKDEKTINQWDRDLKISEDKKGIRVNGRLHEYTEELFLKACRRQCPARSS